MVQTGSQRHLLLKTSKSKCRGVSVSQSESRSDDKKKRSWESERLRIVRGSLNRTVCWKRSWKGRDRSRLPNRRESSKGCGKQVIRISGKRSTRSRKSTRSRLDLMRYWSIDHSQSFNPMRIAGAVVNLIHLGLTRAKDWDDCRRAWRQKLTVKLIEIQLMSL